MRTYCQALLRTAEGGLARATTARRPLARVWSQIGNVLDGDLSILVHDRRLVWMPAHQSIASVGRIVLSNGEHMSVLDWRANRLVDAVAKQAADSMRAPMAITRLLNSGSAAVKHAATLLGQVTHAANNCKMEVVQPDGSRVLKVCRDSQQHTHQQRQMGERSRRASAALMRPPAYGLQAAPSDLGGMAAWSCPAGLRKRAASCACPMASRGAKFARLAHARDQAAEAARTQQRVEEIGSRLSVSTSTVPAEVRMRRLLERVRARALSAQAAEGNSSE